LIDVFSVDLHSESVWSWNSLTNWCRTVGTLCRDVWGWFDVDQGDLLDRVVDVKETIQLYQPDF